MAKRPDCAFCGHRVKKNTDHCRNCGHEIGAVNASAPPPQLHFEPMQEFVAAARVPDRFCEPTRFGPFTVEETVPIGPIVAAAAAAVQPAARRRPMPYPRPAVGPVVDPVVSA